MTEGINEWMNEWINEWMNEWMSGWMNECISIGSLMLYCPQVSISAIFEKRVTDPWTHRPMDKASYRDAWTHLKRGGGEIGQVFRGSE